MRFIGSFFEFSRRVLDSARRGGLPPKDTKKLDNLLTRTGKRNTILAKGILTALSAGGASDKDIARFGALLLKAEERIVDNKEPFTPVEHKEIAELFQRAYMSTKTAQWFSAQIDELVAEEINEFISGSRRMEVGVPAKKTVKFARSEEENEKIEEKKKLRM